ncbi:hypothetical protein [Hydrogenophaga sp.]|uniref:cell envelope integrity protein TolA n=1 Tax=Hydrogenophaga sp. TaxID=1904254 RepID=UPI00261AB300|nr:hypothetical protein [Hydrogenophaga sp.]MCW5654908.1 hypothetical protein [Hydrogenophaga sp.]
MTDIAINLRSALRRARSQGLVLLLAGLCLLGPAPAGAETRNIVAEGTSEACWGRAYAEKIARVAMSNDAHDECRALGSGWRYGAETFGGYVQCNRCGKSDEFRCTIKQAVHTCVNMQKEQEEAAAKKRAEREAQKQAEKDKADRERAQAELHRKEQKDKAERDRAERERLAKEKADRDRIKQQMADREKAAKAAAAREAAQSSSGNAGGDPLDRAFSERRGKSGGQKPAAGAGDVLDDAFNSRRGSSARPSAGTGDVLDDAMTQRKERLVERERQAVLAARTQAATASCQAAAKGVDACLQSACGREPPRTHCTDGYWESGTCNPSPGARCLSIGQYVCRANGPNPAYGTWQSCTTSARAQCAFSGTVEDCVRQRLQAAK